MTTTRSVTRHLALNSLRNPTWVQSSFTYVPRGNQSENYFHAWEDGNWSGCVTCRYVDHQNHQKLPHRADLYRGNVHIFRLNTNVGKNLCPLMIDEHRSLYLLPLPVSGYCYSARSLLLELTGPVFNQTVTFFSEKTQPATLDVLTKSMNSKPSVT